MANAFYTQGLQAIGTKKIDLSTDPLYLQFVDGADYTPNMATDDSLDDVPVGARVGAATLLANQTFVNAILDADDTTVAGVAGDVFEYALLYAAVGSPVVTYPLVLFDTATGLPCTPNGEDITVQWSNGANKIFKLGPA